MKKTTRQVLDILKDTPKEAINYFAQMALGDKTDVKFGFVKDSVSITFIITGKPQKKELCISTKLDKLFETEADLEPLNNYLPSVKNPIKFHYIFEDFVKLEKKTDPKTLQYDNKIDKNSGKREEYFRIKQILSPKILVLDTGLKIRLVGIKEDNSVNGKAVDFLKEKLKGKKVFLKYDAIKHDADDNLFCYRL